MFEDRRPGDVVAQLCREDPAEVSDRRLVEQMVEAAAVAAWAESTGLQALAELRRRRQAAHLELVAELDAENLGGRPADGDEVDRFVAMEASAALRLAHRSAVDRVGLACDLVDRLPATVAAMSAGRISVHHARALRDSTEVLDRAATTAVETDVLPRAERATPSQTAAFARRAAARLDPDAAARRCELARERRRVGSWAVPDGMGVLQVRGPLETVAGAYARIDALARASQDAARAALGRLERPGPADATGLGAEPSAPGRGPREGDLDGVPTLDQLRADIALRLLAGTYDLTSQPSPAVEVAVEVLVPLATLLGASQEPGEIAGQGPVPAEVARALAADRRWQLVLGEVARRSGSSTGCPGSPPGGPGAHGPTTYRPTAMLTRAIRARDVTCRFPGCRRAAQSCDVDHTVPHPDGPTAACNLACLCRMHHRAKHRAGWRMEQLGDGRIRWTSPAGHVSETDPPGRDGPGAAPRAA